MLTTMHDIVNVSRDERKKPHDSTKGGVGVIDLLSSISTRMKSRRWTMNAFPFSLNTARTNARTLHIEFPFYLESRESTCFAACPKTS